MGRMRSMPSRAGTGLGPRLVVLAASVWAAGDAPAQAPAPSSASSTVGYEITRPPQVVTKAPHGWVGRKTTDREKRIGNTPETKGNSYEFVLTIGGFTRKCPNADGIVPGNFEYSLIADEVITGKGETQRTHYVDRVVTKRLLGLVGNDAKLEFVDIEAEYISERTGSPTKRRTVRERFKPGQHGEADIEAMTRAARVTGELPIATVILFAGQNFILAQLEWLRLNQCVEFTFDPPTGGRVLKPNESVDVRTTLRTKDDNASVAGANLQVQAIEAIGSVTPRRIETHSAAPVTITYTASTQPRKGNGIDVATWSRAGLAGGLWRIGDGRLNQAGWSGQIQYTLDTREKERHTVVQDLSGHSSYQTTVTFKDGVGTAAQRAVVKSSRENRGAVDRGGGRFGDNVDYPKRESLDIDGSLAGSTPATVEVKFDAKSGMYQVVPEFAWVIGKQRHVSCIEGTCTTRDYYFSTDPSQYWDNGGKTSDPNHVQGAYTRKGDGLNWTVTWNLSRSN